MASKGCTMSRVRTWTQGIGASINTYMDAYEGMVPTKMTRWVAQAVCLYFNCAIGSSSFGEAKECIRYPTLSKRLEEEMHRLQCDGATG